MSKEGPASRIAAGALLVLFFLTVTIAVSTKSATYDESVHIFSGWRILTAGDFATNHEHPPLMKALAAIPVALSGAAPPKAAMRREVDEWNVSHDFVYHANDGDRMLARTRLPVALLATLLAWALYRYAAAAFGPAAALVALALLVSEPNILAHSGLVTTDLGITALTFFTFAAFVTWLRTRASAWLYGTGLLFGLALLTKFTAILLAPILILTGAIHAWMEGTKRRGDLARAPAVIGLVGLFVLNLGYGFSGSFSSLRSFPPESETFRARAAGPFGGLPLPLPVEYVRGYDHAEAGGQLWWAYLFGEHSRTGWRHYYLAALAVKTPLPLLAMALAGLLLCPRAAGSPRQGAAGAAAIRPADALLPVAPILVYLAAFTLSGNLKNIGLRYILPLYPFLCLMAALAARALWSRIRARRAIIALTAWQLLVAAWMYPDYLTFFNLTVGGPSHGAEVLLDSNLDWGQDLKGLGRYIKDHRIERIYVDYFGRACKRYYGVTSTPDFTGGWIAVSATNLRGVYADDKERYRFLWDLTPAARIGGSIFVYDVPRPEGWTPKSVAGD
ncbi:MAG TPA: glycosyltransferase family 39 protein [Candidatus Polarisedimenticolia bacterium]|jgi:4-amino-4-deoxy-L-arabinose transferase-like glycosyltransferase